MRIIFALLIIILHCLCSYGSEPNEYSEITNDKKIILVLNSLNKTPQDAKTKATILGDNLSKKSIKILFVNLFEFTKGSDDDALTCMDKSGNLYILIDNLHRDAPVEALMSLLSHEVVHQDYKDSKVEELQGWMNEVTEWVALKNLNPSLKNIPENKFPLVDRLNAIEKMYLSGGNTPKNIYAQIQINPAYINTPD